MRRVLPGTLLMSPSHVPSPGSHGSTGPIDTAQFNLPERAEVLARLAGGVPAAPAAGPHHPSRAAAVRRLPDEQRDGALQGVRQAGQKSRRAAAGIRSKLHF